VAAGAGRWWLGGADVQRPWWGPCKFIPALVRELEAVLEAGPAVWGWDEDQCWTLARIAAVVRR